ncbi:MAG TPA: hypothetical protein VHF69_06300 [Candidatus Synoicihabitans sp.]|nr:hypothetical protein [Candidatus Synoicihabitans sp.]
MLIAGMVAATTAMPAQDLPAIRGAVSGELVLSSDLVPPIPWRLEAAPRDSGNRLQFVASPPDGTVRATVELASGAVSNEWAIDEARLEVAPWWRRVGSRLAPDWSAIDLTGAVELTGRGTWDKEGLVGDLHARWNAPRVSLSDPEVVVENLAVTFEAASGWTSGEVAGEGTVTFDRVTAASLVTANGSSSFRLSSDFSWEIGPLEVEALGGRASVAPITWREGTTELTLAVTLAGVELEQLASLAPETLRDARGRVSGRVLLRWSEAAGIVPLDGVLRLDEAATAQVRLSPQPGLLTNRIPRQFNLLPRWLGPVAERWLAPKNPAYAALEAIELGREPLHVDTFRVDFFPPDDPLGRSARVILAGKPAGDAPIERVSITVNLNGPLSDLIRLVFDERVQIDAGTP